MGMFGKGSETCCICNMRPGEKKIEDGMVCKECISKGGNFLIVFSWKNTSSQRVKDGIAANEINQKYMKEFQITKKVEKNLLLDETNRLWTIKSIKNVIFSYDDILDAELIENGENVITGGLGSAVVGGMLFGSIGAMVGGTTGTKKIKKEIRDLQIKIKTKNLVYPEVTIPVISSGKVDPSNPVYGAYLKIAEKYLSVIALMRESERKNNENHESNNVIGSQADELLKFKNLLDMGAVTQEEFDAKKKQLLGL